MRKDFLFWVLTALGAIIILFVLMVLVNYATASVVLTIDDNLITSAIVYQEGEIDLEAARAELCHALMQDFRAMFPFSAQIVPYGNKPIPDYEQMQILTIRDCPKGPRLNVMNQIMRP